MKLYLKQKEFFDACLDKQYHTCVFAGGVGSGKSRVLCFTLLYMCITFPETRYLLGRARISDLTDSTLITLFQVAKEMGVYDFITFNKQKNFLEVVTEKGTSTIVLKALEMKPSDPELISLGSTEYSAAFIDEAGQIDHKIYTTLIQRLRFKLEENNLTGKIVIATNPTQNWLYHNFYIPFERNELSKEVFFTQAVPSDNPFLEKSYLRRLTRENLSEWEFQTRVLLNWNFSEGDIELFEIDKINDAFGRELNSEDLRGRFLSVDIAGQGKDRTVCSIWLGWELLEIRKYSHLTAPETARIIQSIQSEFQIETKNVVIDANGLGSGTADLIRGCYRFVANKSPINKEAFRSIKDQMFYKLADRFRQGKIKLSCYEYIDDIIKELQAHKRYQSSSDRLAAVTPKHIVYGSLSKSPDIADSLVMRCVFDYVSHSPTIELI